jgi:hypothetical protein
MRVRLRRVLIEYEGFPLRWGLCLVQGGVAWAERARTVVRSDAELVAARHEGAVTKLHSSLVHVFTVPLWHVS